MRERINAALVYILLIIAAPFLGMLNGGLLVGAWLILSSYDAFAKCKHKYVTSRLRRRLKGRGRALIGSELLPKLKGGEGTVILECRYYSSLLETGVHKTFWWTDDEIEALAPLQLPGSHRQFHEDPTFTLKKDLYDQLVRQFVIHYLDEEEGTASIIEFPDYVLDTLPKPRTVTLQIWNGTCMLFSNVRQFPEDVAVINTQDRWGKRSESDIEVNDEAGNHAMVVPPLGLHFFKPELWTLCVNILGGLWIAMSCGFVAVWCFPKHPEFLSLHGVVDVFRSVVSFLFGLGCAVGVVNVGRHAVRGWQLLGIALCQSTLMTIGDTLSITESSLIRCQRSTFVLSDVTTIGVCLKDDSYCFTDVMIGWSKSQGLDVDGPAFSRLIIHCHDRPNAALLVGRDAKELQWIATVVRRWLNCPAPLRRGPSD